MSTTIEQKVVEMRFDNKHFEQHTKESMSTLEKLKQKLNLSGASKGLENLNTSANKVNMNGLCDALDTTHSKFSALEIMGVTALANITNSAVNAGKRIVKALTIDPVTDGWREYEMTLNAVQTTMAATGKTSAEVEKELKKLDEYADKTVYSTADMLNNLPKFTNAGVELETATQAMIGIANATAHAGGDAGKASIAFYNLGQAIGTGYLTRMDYNSINNAGIATMKWKEEMVEAAIAAGTLTRVGDDLYQAGNKTMTMQQLFIDGLQEQWASTEVMLEVFGKYGDETTEIGKAAYSSAQDIKTFSMMMDSLKATAGTGWKDTWQIIFGGLEEAKEFWTGLNNFISGIIEGMADFRNFVLDSALGRSFGHLLDGIKKPFKAIENTIDNIKDYTKVVDEIIDGKWGNYTERWNRLTEAGYDWKHAQNLVNEQLGFSLRRATDYKEVQGDIVKTQEKANETTTDYILELIKLSDAELKAKNYSDEQIASLRELERVSRQTGIPLKQFVEQIDEIDGRWILINSFKNIGQGLVATFGAIRDAWLDIFPPTGNVLFNIIAGFHKFTTYLTVSEQAADKLRRTFKGVFAVLDMILTVISLPAKIAFKILLQLLGALDIGIDGILSFTARIGDALVKVRDFLDELLDFSAVFEFLAPYIKAGAKAVWEWIKALKNSSIVTKFIDGLRKAKNAIKDWILGIKDAENIPKYIFEGLINGLKYGVGTVLDTMIDVGKKLIDVICKVLGIHSPSKVFFEIGKNIIQGLYDGISSLVQMIYDLVMSIGTKLTEIVKGLDLGSIFTIAIGAGSVYGFVKFAQAIEALTSPMEAFADIAKTFNITLKKFNGVLSAFKFKLLADSLKSMAIAIAILVGSIVVLTMVDQGKLLAAVATVVVLAAVLAGLAAVAGKFGGKEGVQFGKLSLTLLALGVSMLLMASALKKIAKINPEQYNQAIVGFITLMASLILLMATVNRNKTGFIKLGAAFIGIASALLVMATVTKILGKMDREQLIQGGLAILAFSAIIVGLMAATKLLTGSKNVDKIATTIGKIGTALLMMAIVAKILGKMDREQLIQGGLAILAFSAIIVGLMAATKLISGSTNVDKIGKAIFGISAGLLMMALVAKLCASMEPGDLLKGTLAITAFSGIVVGLMAATKLLTGSKNVDKIGKTILMVSVAIGLMAISAALLSLIDTANLAKGVIAVGFISAMVAGLIAVTHFAKNVKGTMIAITVAIGILALSVGLLSMIDPTKLAGATIALGILLGMFALVIAASSMAAASIGPLIVMTVAIGVLAGALYLIAQLPIENALAATISLSTLLIALSASLVMLSVVGTLGAAAFIGIAALATLIIALTAVVVAIGYFMEEFPALENFLDSGLAALIKLAGGLGEMVGAFVKGALTQIVSSLPIIGTQLSTFMTNLTPFITGAKMVDGDVLAGVGILAAAIIALTAASLIEGITSFMPFVGSFADLGTQLSLFMTNAAAFINGASMIKPEMVESIKTLAEALMIITAANLVEGLNRLLGGGSSVETFATQLPILGNGIRAFITSLGTISEDQVVTAKNAANIIKTLAQAAAEIPNTGGLLGDLIGNNDMGPWSEQLPIMAKGISDFIKILAENDITEESVQVANTAAKIIKTLAQAASEIPNTGGLLADLVGDNDLSTFASGLPEVAEGIAGFVKVLTDAKVTEEGASIANTAAKIVKTLAKTAQEIPNTGGLLAGLVGDNDLSDFSSGLPEVAKGIKGFAKNLGTFTPDKVETVNCAVSALEAISKLDNIGAELSNTRIVAFGDSINTLASKLKSFVNKMSEVGADNITSAINKTKEFINLLNDFPVSNPSIIATFGDKLKQFASVAIDGFVKEFTSVEPKLKVVEGISKILDAAIKAADAKKKDVTKTFEEIGKAAAKSLCTDTIKDEAKQAGKDLGNGLINGIKAKYTAAYQAGYALGQKAVQGEKDGQKSKSPSKLTHQAGIWLGEGLVNGMVEMGRKVYNAGHDLGDQATRSMSSTISKVADAINSDMDTQPTIRPVLDLSDIESGAGYLNNMFNNGPSIGVQANLGAISAGMNARLQNGVNGEVVSAIDKLRKDLGNVGGTTNNYNVNGVTYDDGSNITEAVRTIVRAATMGRRV